MLHWNARPLPSGSLEPEASRMIGLTWLDLTGRWTFDLNNRRVVRLLERLHAPVQPSGEVSLERRSPAVHRGHPWVRVSLRVEVEVGDVGQLIPLSRETPSPTAEPGMSRVG